MPSFDRDGALKRAEKALRQGRIDAVIAEYLDLTEAEPRDWATAQTLGDLYTRAGQIGRALAQYARTADHMATEGLLAEAAALFQKSLKLKPDDSYATTRVRQISQQIEVSGGLGDVPSFRTEQPPAAEHPEQSATPDAAEFGDDPFLMDDGLLTDDEVAEPEDDRLPAFTAAEAALREGRLEEGRRIVGDALQVDPQAKETALSMAYRVAAASPDAGYQVIDVIVDRSVGDNDYGGAAAALQEFVTRVPHHLLALMRLVEIAMDGGLEATMYEAQAQLADAYLDEGRGLEARIISEDLVAREPWNRANIERFRKALALLGEADPDAVIAGRLGGESPFLTTDLLEFDRQDDGDEGIEGFAADEPGGAQVPSVPAASATAVDPLVGEERAAAQYRLGQTFRDLGLLDDAVRALEGATSSEQLRFRAAILLGAIHRQRGHSVPAIEWLDSAVRWAPPATDIGRAVRYDLGGVLEEAGDHDRALAVFTGLESERGGYRDVSVRIQRLLMGRTLEM